jgi:hypothetical protein
VTIAIGKSSQVAEYIEEAHNEKFGFFLQVKSSNSNKKACS